LAGSIFKGNKNNPEKGLNVNSPDTIWDIYASNKAMTSKGYLKTEVAVGAIGKISIYIINH